MGQSNNTIMNIHICGLDLKDKNNYNSQMKILNILFPKTDKNRSCNDYIFKYSEKPKWNALIYSERNTQNFKLINETIQKNINKNNGENKKRKDEIDKKEALKNHIILLFVCDNDSDNKLCEEFTKDETIDALNENFPLLLFIFKDTNRNNLYYQEKFFDFTYINCVNLSSIELIKENKEKSNNEDLIALYLKSLLYNNYDSYFTERGHKIIDEIDPLSKIPKIGIYLPIVLVGSPGVGKSTFINTLNGYRISKASSSDLPVTSKSAIYDVKIPSDDNNDDIQINNEDLKQEAFLRLIDTPGFDLEKDIDIALKEIKQIFSNFKEGKERVPVVLYFMNPFGRNSTKDINKKKKILNILKYLKEEKVKVLFVVTHLGNGERWQKKSSFIQLLKENGLEKLIENDESNIIKCQLVGENGYGIKEIFKKIYRYLNVIEDDNYNPTEEVYNQSLIDGIKKRNTFDEKLAFIKTKTSLFNEFQSKEDIITYARKKSYLLMISLTLAAAAAGSIPIPFVDAAIVLNILGSSIVKIGKFYGYVWKKISRKDLLSIYKGELYRSINNFEGERMNTLLELFKLVGEIFLKSLIMVIALNIDDVVKYFWGIGTIIGMAIGAVVDSGIVCKYSRNAKNYFESKCKQDDGTLFFCTRCSEYEVIFRKFKQFENYKLVYPTQ